MPEGESKGRWAPHSHVRSILEGLMLYQDNASKTAKYPGRFELKGLLYVTLGLAGEAGELANKVKKILRDNNEEITDEIRVKLRDELGDVLWYTSQVASELGTHLGLIGIHNLDKLSSRLERDKIKGEGDNR